MKQKLLAACHRAMAILNTRSWWWQQPSIWPQHNGKIRFGAGLQYEPGLLAFGLHFYPDHYSSRVAKYHLRILLWPFLADLWCWRNRSL